MLDKLRTFVLKWLSCCITFSLLSVISPRPLRLNILRFAFPADYSLTFAAAAPQMARGGITAANRGTQRHQPGQPPRKCVNSAPSSLISACHFSGFMPQMAQPMSHRKLPNLSASLLKMTILLGIILSIAVRSLLWMRGRVVDALFSSLQGVFIIMVNYSENTPSYLCVLSACAKPPCGTAV